MVSLIFEIVYKYKTHKGQQPMKHIKKIITILLVVALAVSMAACGDSESDKVYITPGEIDTKAKVYKNNYLGIQCKLGDEWILYSSKDIAGYNGLTGDAVTDNDIAMLISDPSVGICYDMIASTNDSYKSIDIAYQQYEYAEVGYDEEQFAKTMAEKLPEELEGYGITDAETNAIELKFAGRDCHGVRISGVANDIKIYEQQIYIINGGNMAIITLKSSKTDETDSILKFFSKL